MKTPRFDDFYSVSFEQVSGAVRAFCGDDDLAFDATQEAFARAFSRWKRVSNMDMPAAWVTATALNLIRRHHSKKVTGRRQHLNHVPGPTVDRLELLAALRQLPERQRQAMVLHYLIDCPVTTVAEIMRLSEGTVKAHLHRGRTALHRLLEVGHG